MHSTIKLSPQNYLSARDISTRLHISLGSLGGFEARQTDGTAA